MVCVGCVRVGRGEHALVAVAAVVEAFEVFFEVFDVGFELGDAGAGGAELVDDVAEGVLDAGLDEAFGFAVAFAAQASDLVVEPEAVFGVDAHPRLVGWVLVGVGLARGGVVVGGHRGGGLRWGRVGGGGPWMRGVRPSGSSCVRRGQGITPRWRARSHVRGARGDGWVRGLGGGRGLVHGACGVL